VYLGTFTSGYYSTIYAEFIGVIKSLLAGELLEMTLDIDVSNFIVGFLTDDFFFIMIA